MNEQTTKAMLYTGAFFILLTTIVGIGTELHKTRLDLVATRTRVDAEVAAIRDLSVVINPKASRWVCPEHDGKPEVDLGIPHPCDDGMCVEYKGQTLNQSAVQARCSAGKL